MILEFKQSAKLKHKHSELEARAEPSAPFAAYQAFTAHFQHDNLRIHCKPGERKAGR